MAVQGSKLALSSLSNGFKVQNGRALEQCGGVTFQALVMCFFGSRIGFPKLLEAGGRLDGKRIKRTRCIEHEDNELAFKMARYNEAD